MKPRVAVTIIEPRKKVATADFPTRYFVGFINFITEYAMLDNPVNKYCSEVIFAASISVRLCNRRKYRT